MKYHRPKFLKKMSSTHVETSFVSDVKHRMSVTEINRVKPSENKNIVRKVVKVDEEINNRGNRASNRESYMAVSNLLGGQILDEEFTKDIEEYANLSTDGMSDEESVEETEIELSIYNQLESFESVYKPEEMRCLALIAHNHMKPALKKFVETYHVLLRKFRLTGTDSTMRMVKSIIGDDPDVKYGPTCTSGPLGGDAQLSALMCMEDLGGAVFFIDPLSAHPHQADIDSLTRLANVHNILLMPNPASACAMCYLLREALEKGYKHMIASFFTTLQSPAVEQYKREQDILVKSLQEEDK